MSKHFGMANTKFISVVWWRSESGLEVSLEFNYMAKGLRMVN
jgi:hypothetical protein